MRWARRRVVEEAQRRKHEYVTQPKDPVDQRVRELEIV
jgi:hypothetical protein